MKPRRAKYQLDTLVRTTVAKDPEAFQCVYQMEDDTGEGRGLMRGVGWGGVGVGG
jgi:hypothetical protein